MRAAIVSLGSLSSKWIYEELKKYFDEVDFLNLKKFEVLIDSKECGVFYEGESLKHYDCIYARGSFKYAELLQSITAILREKGTYMPLASSLFPIAHDKLLTHLYLQRKGVPMPRTDLVSDIDAAKEMLKQIKYPIVMKFPKGTHGKGVMFGESYSNASAILDAFSALKQPLLIQEFIDNGGVDYRAIVVGDKVVAAMKRVAAKGEMRSNVHAGGVGEPIELEHSFKMAALDSARILKADILAVDLMQDHRGPRVLEVNSSPGLQGITGATKINVADKIAKFLYTKTKSIVDAGKPDVMEELKLKNVPKQLTTNIKVRGGKIILPDFVTDMTKFREDEELIFEAKDGKLIVERL